MIISKVIADSTANGIRLTTLELNYPRFIHSQFMTHRMFSRNTSSSRAIPVSKTIKEVEENPAMPIHWGKNQPGMQAEEELDNERGKLIWLSSRNRTVDYAEQFNKAGYHKQIVNRLLEPFSHIKAIVTATEWEGFFKLRLDHDAQPEIQELARVMKEVMDSSIPQELTVGKWHLPYVSIDEIQANDYSKASMYQMLKVSVARCARVSYNNHDNSFPDIQKDIELADKLIAAGHMSPAEHQLTPMLSNQFKGDFKNLEEGVTHVDRNEFKWSGNARGWLMYRQLL